MGAQTNGCGSCKRRKVKCDDTRPKCTRCLRAGIECTGFKQRLRFVDENPRVQRSIAMSHAQSHAFSIAKDSPAVFQSSPVRRSLSLSPPHVLPKTIPLTAFKEEIIISYLISKLFEGQYEGKNRCGLPKCWTLELAHTDQKPRYKSWDALAALVFGQAHKRHDMITKAIVLYGQALLELYNKLTNPDRRRTNSMLASMTALCIYEILKAKREQGWMVHANGLRWLLEWRGPWQQKPYVGLSISFDHRIMLITKSIMSQQRTFLHDLSWKTVPWEDDPAAKSAIDYLVDIGADISEYLAQIKVYMSSKSNHAVQHSRTRTQVTTSLKELNTWWQQWETDHTPLAKEVMSNQASSPPLFPTLLEFDTLWTAFTFSMYNAMRILLLQLWHRLQLVPNIETIDQVIALDLPNGTALLGISSNVKGLACEILRSFTYCYRTSPSFVSTFSFLFVQEVAYGCFDPGSNEALWVAEHGWAEPAKFPDSEDANLLNQLVPLGQIKLGGGNLVTSGTTARVLRPF